MELVPTAVNSWWDPWCFFITQRGENQELTMAFKINEWSNIYFILLPSGFMILFLAKVEIPEIIQSSLPGVVFLFQQTDFQCPHFNLSYLIPWRIFQ